MKKIIKICFVTFFLINVLSAYVFANDHQNISIVIDGVNQDFPTKPILIHNSIFLPTREIFEALGIDTYWSPEFKEVTGVKDDYQVIIKIGSKSALVNNKLIAMPQAAFICNDKTMVPIRFISDVFNMDVSWDNNKKQIIINTNKSNSQDDDFSYKDCITQGIKKSADCNSAILNYEKAHESNEDLFITLGTYDIGMIQAKRDFEMYDKWAEMQIAITAERVGLNIKNLMDEISLMKQEKLLLEDRIEFLIYKKQMDKLKYDHGLISLNEFKNTETEYEIELLNLVDLKKKINLSYIKLNSALERSQSIQGDLEYKIDYEPIGDLDLENKIIRSMEEDPYIWYCKENLESKNFKLITYEYNLPDGKSYTLTELDVSEARKNLLDTEKELDRVIRERYNNLLQLEDRLITLELTYTQVKRAVNIVRLQFDLGMATQVQLEEAQLKVINLEYEIQKVKQQHEQVKVLLEKPYLAPEYFLRADE